MHWTHKLLDMVTEASRVGNWYHQGDMHGKGGVRGEGHARGKNASGQYASYLNAFLLLTVCAVWGKVMFSQAFVILSTGGGGGCIHPTMQWARGCIHEG